MFALRIVISPLASKKLYLNVLGIFMIFNILTAFFSKRTNATRKSAKLPGKSIMSEELNILTTM